MFPVPRTAILSFRTLFLFHRSTPSALPLLFVSDPSPHLSTQLVLWNKQCICSCSCSAALLSLHAPPPPLPFLCILSIYFVHSWPAFLKPGVLFCCWFVSQVQVQVDELGQEAQNWGSLGASLGFLYIKELKDMYLTWRKLEYFVSRTSDISFSFS